MAGTLATAEAHVHMARAPVPGEPHLSSLPGTLSSSSDHWQHGERRALGEASWGKRKERGNLPGPGPHSRAHGLGRSWNKEKALGD